jgi:hypothetical protein
LVSPPHPPSPMLPENTRLMQLTRLGRHALQVGCTAAAGHSSAATRPRATQNSASLQRPITRSSSRFMLKLGKGDLSVLDWRMRTARVEARPTPLLYEKRDHSILACGQMQLQKRDQSASYRSLLNKNMDAVEMCRPSLEIAQLIQNNKIARNWTPKTVQK